MVRRIGLIVVFTLLFYVIVTGMFGGIAAEANAKPNPTLNTQDEASITCNHWGLRNSALSMARQDGTKVIRINFLEWRDCPEAFTAPQAVINAGMKPQLSIAGSKTYMKMLVSHFDPIVTTWSIWNEPDLGVFMCCSAPWKDTGFAPGPAKAYRKTYMHMYKYINKVSKSNKVLFCECSPHGMGKAKGKKLLKAMLKRSWIAKVLRGKKPLRADGIAVHPYSWHWTNNYYNADKTYYHVLKTFKKTVKIWAKRKKLRMPKGKKPVAIYNTEWGIPYWGSSETTRARLVRQVWKQSKRLGFKQHSQYQVYAGYNHEGVPQEWNTSVTNPDCTPTKSFFMLRRLTKTKVPYTGTPVNCPQPTGAKPPYQRVAQAAGGAATATYR